MTLNELEINEFKPLVWKIPGLGDWLCLTKDVSFVEYPVTNSNGEDEYYVLVDHEGNIVGFRW